MLNESRRLSALSLETLERRQMLSAAVFRLVQDPQRTAGDEAPTILVRADKKPTTSSLTSGGTTSTSSGSAGASNVTSPFTINIVPGSGLASNSAALAAFDRAAALWEARITDPITVTIDADLSNLGSSSIIGQTGSVILESDYATIRGSIVADAADEADDGIVASIPTSANFLLPSGLTYDGTIAATKANLKALGYDLDGSFGASDADITFNSQFGFDYDNSDGVSAGKMDFETVAAHEIGHALGFVSAVDDVDYYSTYSVKTNVGADALDLFRFENNVAGGDPSTAAEFGSFARSLRSGVDAVTDDITGWETSAAENRMSTGVGTGDGRQASHWKDGDLTGASIGILDPTLAYGQTVGISDADWRALDLIGWDISDPTVNTTPVDPVDPVGPTPTAPVAGDDSGAIDEDHVLTANAPGVLGNDSDTNGETVSAVAFTGASAKGAKVVLNADGSYTYDPRTATALQALNTGQSTDDSFTYTVQNTSGLTSTATVTINVSGVTDVVAPAAPTTGSVTSDGSTSRLTIKWVDKSNNETGFRIKRSKVSNFSSGVSTFTVGANATSFSDSGLSANTTYYYRVTAYNSAYESSYTSASGKTHAAYAITTAGTGLTGKYYYYSNFTSLKTTRTDAAINFNWGTGRAVSNVPSDNFTVRWTGQVLPTYDESYTFYAKMDDNVRVWIDDPTDSVAPKLIIRRWGSSNANEYKSAPIALKAGRKYNIQIDYRERTGSASAILKWASASVGKSVIPTKQLFKTGSSTVYTDPSGESSSPTIGTDNGSGASALVASTGTSKSGQKQSISITTNKAKQTADDYLLAILR